MSATSSTGDTLDDAEEVARSQVTRFPADGLDTLDTWLMAVDEQDGHTVGRVWLGPHPDRERAA